MSDSNVLSLFRNRATALWACFVVGTVLSWWLGAHGDPSDALAVLVFAIGCLKGCFVGLEFMEVRHAPTWLRAVFGGWLLIVFVALSGLILVA